MTRSTTAAAVAALSLASAFASAAVQGGPGSEAAPRPTLAEARLTMEKWIETEQVLAKERKEWQQGKEILTGRLELVAQEIAALEEKLALAQAGVAQASAKRDELTAQNDELEAAGAQLTGVVTGFEGDVRRLMRTLPEPLQKRLLPLFQRMPEDPATTKVSVAERFQNVLGMLNEANKANQEMAVEYEVRELSAGSRAEVRVLYVGLAQAYYVSSNGEAGIGRPADDGWRWEASKAIAGDVLQALDIASGKQTPAFVPLPVKIR